MVLGDIDVSQAPRGETCPKEHISDMSAQLKNQASRSKRAHKSPASNVIEMVCHRSTAAEIKDCYFSGLLPHFCAHAMGREI